MKYIFAILMILSTFIGIKSYGAGESGDDLFNAGAAYEAQANAQLSAGQTAPAAASTKTAIGIYQQAIGVYGAVNNSLAVANVVAAIGRAQNLLNYINSIGNRPRYLDGF